MSERPSGDALVIGLGNPLMGDDGIGLAALERLAAHWHLPPTIELLDGGTWGLNLLHRIEATGQVLFLDAVRAGRGPGDLIELDRCEVSRRLDIKLSPHQIDLREVLALAEWRGALPSRLSCLGLEPDSVELRAGLSPAVSGRLDRLVDAAAARLRAWGHPVARRGGACACMS
jgi:hydrogenase maturation protease